MTQLSAPLADLAGLLQDAVHGADRAQVGSLVQQGGEDFVWCLVLEALGMQHVEDPLLFGGRQGAGRTRAWGCGSGWLTGAEVAIERSPRHVERAAGGRPAHRLAELVGGSHEFSSPLLTSGSEIPSRADTFFCTSMMSSACSRRRLRRAFSFRRRWFSSVSGLAVDLRPLCVVKTRSDHKSATWSVSGTPSAGMM